VKDEVLENFNAANFRNDCAKWGKKNISSSEWGFGEKWKGEWRDSKSRMPGVK
jgi:hypothetical protein